MHEQPVRVCIPIGVSFADLQLARAADGSITLDIDVINRILTTNRVDPEPFQPEHPDGETNTSHLLIGWYLVARAEGQPEDAVMEQLLAELEIENAAGQGFSLAPGHA
jgi:hypothetical protein